MNRRVVLLSVIAFVVASLSVTSLVRNDSDSDFDMGMGMKYGSHSSELYGSDAMFLQMMIPHHQQAILLSEMAISTSKNSDILKLANQIKAAQTPEIAQMKSWLKSAGLGEDPGHSMHSMAGMLSDREIEQLKSASGTDFDTLFLRGMIAHHQGAVDMVAMIENSKNSELKRFGKQIKTSQSKEIDLMNEILRSIG
jgi:uncharacterized protein (DUF305 family)